MWLHVGRHKEGKGWSEGKGVMHNNEHTVCISCYLTHRVLTLTRLTAFELNRPVLRRAPPLFTYAPLFASSPPPLHVPVPPHTHTHPKGREPLFVSCTALGCIELLERTNTPIKGQHAVVIGRSNIVGMPVALLLLKRDATVTVCHSATQDMEALVQQADIVVAAVGQEQLVKVRCEGGGRRRVGRTA